MQSVLDVLVRLEDALQRRQFTAFGAPQQRNPAETIWAGTHPVLSIKAYVHIIEVEVDAGALDDAGIDAAWGKGKKSKGHWLPVRTWKRGTQVRQLRVGKKELDPAGVDGAAPCWVVTLLLTPEECLALKAADVFEPVKPVAFVPFVGDTGAGADIAVARIVADWFHPAMGWFARGTPVDELVPDVVADRYSGLSRVVVSAVTGERVSDDGGPAKLHLLLEADKQGACVSVHVTGSYYDEAPEDVLSKRRLAALADAFKTALAGLAETAGMKKAKGKWTTAGMQAAKGTWTWEHEALRATLSVTDTRDSRCLDAWLSLPSERREAARAALQTMIPS